MAFNSNGGFSPFSSYTTSFLENLLLVNPGVQTFPLSINAEQLAGNPGAPNIDVTRAQILNELQNRIAFNKQNSVEFDNQIYSFASSVGSQPLSQVEAGDPNVVSPATPGVGPAIPAQVIGQII